MRDNGNGFDLYKVKKGLGINNIRNCVDLYQGKLAIRTVPGKGCTLPISLPLHPVRKRNS